MFSYEDGKQVKVAYNSSGANFTALVEELQSECSKAQDRILFAVHQYINLFTLNPSRFSSLTTLASYGEDVAAQSVPVTSSEIIAVT